jgi:hypothetical protein
MKKILIKIAFYIVIGLLIVLISGIDLNFAIVIGYSLGVLILILFDYLFRRN